MEYKIAEINKKIYWASKYIDSASKDWIRYNNRSHTCKFEPKNYPVLANKDFDKLVESFIHYIYEKSNGYLMVTDF